MIDADVIVSVLLNDPDRVDEVIASLAEFFVWGFGVYNCNPGHGHLVDVFADRESAERYISDWGHDLEIAPVIGSTRDASFETVSEDLIARLGVHPKVSRYGSEK